MMVVLVLLPLLLLFLLKLLVLSFLLLLLVFLLIIFLPWCFLAVVIADVFDVVVAFMANVDFGLSATVEIAVIQSNVLVAYTVITCKCF